MTDKLYVKCVDEPLWLEKAAHLIKENHLKNNHKAVYSQLKQLIEPSKPTQANTSSQGQNDQPSTATSFEKSQPYSHQSKRWKDLNEAMAYFICKDRLPICTVEKEGFRELMKTLDSRYEVPSRIYFSNSIIIDLYTSTKGKVAQLLSKVKCFAGTTDLWSRIGFKLCTFRLYCSLHQWRMETPVNCPVDQFPSRSYRWQYCRCFQRNTRGVKVEKC